jgi:uncharacterized protein
MLAVVGLGAADPPGVIQAAKSGNLAALRAAVKRGDVNAAQPDGTTALHWAAHRNDADAIDLLLQAGGNAKVRNRYGVTPLALAAAGPSAPVVERLLKAGADPNATLVGGETPLMTASRGGHTDVVRALLAHGADVDARERTRGQTALMWAAAQGHSETIRALLTGGADLKSRATGPTSLRDNKPDANTSGLLLFLGVRAPRLDALTPLMFAVRHGHFDATRVLVDGGADVKDAAPDGTSVLELAIANANYEVADLLLDKGADPTVSANGWTPLHRLARTRKPSLGYIPGIVGAQNPKGLDVARKLIAKGADVNARQVKPVDDSYRQMLRLEATPFWLAAKYVDVALMRLLLDAGADPNLRLKNGTTSLMAAAGVGMLYLSEDTGTDEDTLEAVRLCVERGVDVNAANEDGDTVLHGAARRGLNPVVEFLVERGARLDARNKRKLTPFAVAEGAQRGDRQPHTAKLLRELMIARNIEIEEIDKSLFDPLKRPGPVEVIPPPPTDPDRPDSARPPAPLPR